MADARKVAVAILKDIFEEKTYSAIAIDRKLRGSELDGRDKAFVTNIVYGTLSNLKYLDFQINSYSKINIKKMSAYVLCILRMSIYQIVFMDKVPESAAVNEGVKLAKKLCYKSSGFVNAVLRSFLREGEKLPSIKDKVKYLSIKYSFEEYMVSMWLERFGEDVCERMLISFNTAPKIAVRVNKTKISREELIEKIGGECGSTPDSVLLSHTGSVADIEGFKEGLFTVQDVSAQMVGHIAAPKEGEKVLDMCAAPGGKTTHMAELMKNTGEVVAWDIHQHKIPLIEESAKRLGLTNITAYVHDGREADEKLFEKFDTVLLDAPCSGLGIIKKKPEIKWARTKDDIKEIIKEQEKLFDIGANYVKNGGVFLYSTCTVNEEENEKQVETFLGRHKDFYLDGEMINILPDDEKDGFFIARLMRKNK